MNNIMYIYVRTFIALLTIIVLIKMNNIMYINVRTFIALLTIIVLTLIFIFILLFVIALTKGVLYG